MHKYPEFADDFHRLIIDEGHIEYFKQWSAKEIISDPEQAKGVMEEVLRICDEKDYFLGKAWSLGFLGWYYNDYGIYDKSVEYQLQAYRIFYDRGNEKGQLYTANGLMIAYFQIGFYELSIQYGTTALRLARKVNDEKYIVIIINNICLNYIRANKYVDAKNAMEYLWNLNYENNDICRIQMYQIRAEIECEIGSLDKALKFVNDSIEIIEKNSDGVMGCESLRIRGKINSRLGNEIQAEVDFEKSLNIAMNEKCKDTYAYTLLDWARFHGGKKDVEKAVEKLLKALEISKEINGILLIKEIYNELYTSYKNMERYKEALECYEKYNVIENKLNNNDNNTKFLNFENERRKHEVDLYKSLYNEIKIISTIGQKITSDLNFDNILENTHSEISMIMKVDVVGIAKLNESEELLEYALFIDKGNRIALKNVSIHDELSLGAYCVRNKTTLLINDLYKEYVNYVPKISEEHTPNDTRATMYCPLMIENKVKGFLNVQSYKKDTYTENDLNKLKILASYVVIALENSYLYNQTKYFASHDYLTGLLSRNEVFEQGKKAFKKCSESNTKLASIMIDIDNFKNINDRYGHSAGDVVLKLIGSIINDKVGNYGFSGRYGGEEILIILSEISRSKAYSIGEDIRQTIEKCNISDEIIENLHVTASLGIFIYDGNEENIEQCVRFADEALYVAKAEGKNKIVEYENYI
ncbi:GGDEF domain-containing protein [Clostridium sp.]|uniref:GGDEF domain-containing protein n=1 Tax=Clostridium sp. TaxID=1506 RepID=UPI0032162573